MKTPAKLFLVGGSAGALLLLGYFQGYLHGMTGGMTGMLADANKVKEENLERLALRGSKNSFVGQLDIEVKEKPFGMHVRRGSVIVEEVFHGFLAEKLGVREGCEILRIAGQDAKQGTWLEIFQKTAAPFSLSLNCPPQSNQGHGPMSTDKHNYRVMVVKRPFGMNIQVNVVPRVVEVLPGSIAEKAGVRPGFVLTHVQDKAVDAKSWFDAWQHVALPGILTFDTDMPLNENNTFFNHSSDKSFALASHPEAPAHPNLPDEWHDDNEAVPGFDDIRISVKELPFGMHIDAPVGKLPIVAQLTAKSPAEVAGVKVGDVLLKIAGHRIDSSTWYSAFQHAVPPFGLHFRRPHATVQSGRSNLSLPVMPTFGEMTVSVSERPFGMKVRRSSREVQQVFDGFPSQKVGVRKGCQILEIAGQNFSEGTWMELFQKTALPFSLKLFCPKAVKDSKTVAAADASAAAAASQDEHAFNVVVKERPFGMNIQAHNVPRVVEVLPGYPAEAAGIKAGFVLIAINGQPVDAQTWFDIWTQMPAGAVLTFDTNMTMQPDNPFFPGAPGNKSGQAMDLNEGYSDFRAAVKKLPFGMQLRAPQNGSPTVRKITSGSPAEEAGIKVGDVLIQVAGLPVEASDWFKAFSQAVPPFGLHFRRPDETTHTNSTNSEIPPDERVNLQIMKRPEETTNRETSPEGKANIMSESLPEQEANTQNSTRPEQKAKTQNEAQPVAASTQSATMPEEKVNAQNEAQPLAPTTQSATIPEEKANAQNEAQPVEASTQSATMPEEKANAQNEAQPVAASTQSATMPEEKANAQNEAQPVAASTQSATMPEEKANAQNEAQPVAASTQSATMPEEKANAQNEAQPGGKADIQSETRPEEKANIQNVTRPEEKVSIQNETRSEARASNQNETSGGLRENI